jgi:hypothetical protein
LHGCRHGERFSLHSAHVLKTASKLPRKTSGIRQEQVSLASFSRRSHAPVSQKSLASHGRWFVASIGFSIRVNWEKKVKRKIKILFFPMSTPFWVSLGKQTVEDAVHYHYFGISTALGSLSFGRGIIIRNALGFGARGAARGRLSARLNLPTSTLTLLCRGPWPNMAKSQ